MRRTLRKAILGIVATATAVGFMAAAVAAWPMHPKFYGGAPEWVRDLKTPDYASQKVIYHLSESAGLRDGRYRHLLQVAGNHVAAVGKDRLDLRVIMQSEGVDMLERARHNSELRGRIDKLRADGVRFLICRNTLVARGINPDRDLYGVKREDIIRAGVGEIASLQAQGFVYMKP